MSTQKLVPNIQRSIIPTSQKAETIHMSINLGINKQKKCTHTMDYYLAI